MSAMPAATAMYGWLVEDDHFGLRARFAGFAFAPASAPLTTWRALGAIPLYLLVIWLLKAVAGPGGGAGRGNGVARAVVFAHNIFLSAASGVMMCLLGREVMYSFVTGGGAGRVGWFCGAEVSGGGGRFDLDANTGWLTFIYYINYLFKFYEMLDTAFLAARGKPTPFLHVYHHAATLLLSWSQLIERSGVQWVPISLNLSVHTVMYYYYAAATLGRSVWWKRYLTTMQIFQFVVDVVACGAATWLKYEYDFAGGQINCGGSVLAGGIGLAILGSYLVLFIKMYRDTYVFQQKGKSKRA